MAWRGRALARLLACLALVWACGTGVEADEPAEAPAPQQAPEDIGSPETPEGEPPPVAQAEPGTTLQDFLAAAVEHNPRLGIAAETRRVHSARKAGATGRLLPHLTASGSVTENRRDALGRTEDFRGERYSLQLRQVLFDWSAFAARRRAQRLEEMHEARYDHELSLLLTEVADRYLLVLQAQDALASIQAELEAVASQAEQVQSLFDRQLAPVTDLRHAQASLAWVRAEQIRLRSDVDLARGALQAASGLSVGQLQKLSEQAAAPRLEHDLEHWVQLALDNSPQIHAGRLAAAAAGAGVSEARGALLPNLSLVALRQNSDLGFDNAPIRETDISYVGVDVSMPLFSGGTGWAAVREAKGQRGVAERELQQVELDTRERVRGAYLQLQHSEALVEAARAVVASATLFAQSMQRELALGTVTRVDVLRAIRERFAAERDLQEARYDNIRHFLLLKHESGTLTAEDMAAVSDWFGDLQP